MKDGHTYQRGAERDDWRRIVIFGTEFFRLDNFDILGIGMVAIAIVAAALAVVIA